MTDDQLSASRLLSVDVLAEPVEPDPGSAVLRTAAATLAVGAVGAVADVEVGLWEGGPGSDTDTEIDEVFLVLSGAGTVTFADGSALPLRPGVLVRLREGDRTTWEITDRLRKLYVA